MKLLLSLLILFAVAMFAVAIDQRILFVDAVAGEIQTGRVYLVQQGDGSLGIVAGDWQGCWRLFPATMRSQIDTAEFLGRLCMITAKTFVDETGPKKRVQIENIAIAEPSASADW